MSRVYKIWIHCLDLLFPRGNMERIADSVTIEELRTLVSVSRVWSDTTFSILPYRNKTVRAVIHALKYRGRTKLGALLGTLAYETLLEEISDILLYSPNTKILVVPIPLSRARYRSRGYNQAEVIARAFVSNDPTFILSPHLLSKVRDTPSQTAQDTRDKRLANLTGAFRVASPQSVSGATILLIDDVITTGATLGEATRTLKSSGAHTVIGIAIAH